MASANGNDDKPSSNSNGDDDDSDGNDSVIDEEQLEEYRDMVEQLGSFPDKVKINSLSMVAEDHSDSKGSAKALYNVIRQRLTSTNNVANLLPLVYLVDSILKNVKGKYVEVVEADADTWIPVVYKQLPEPQRQKLHRVWTTWKDSQLFAPERLQAMGRCFGELQQPSNATTTAAATTAASSRLPTGLNALVGGITRASDGRLLLSATLRRAMEDILDQMQSDMENELEKVSLERLADLNPDLLATIKQTALDVLRTRDRDAAHNNGSHGSGGPSSSSSTASLPTYFVETRPPDAVQRCKAWGAHKWNFPQDANTTARKLKELVNQESSDTSKRYSQHDVFRVTQMLASALATASILEVTTERIQRQQSQKDSISHAVAPPNYGFARQPGGLTIDKALFTNKGVREKNETVIGMLYEVGLPFLSSVDGRRFATQLELSKHLDVLFKRNQLEKSIARTDERGWFVADAVWRGDHTEDEGMALASSAVESTDDSRDDGYDPRTSSVPADETRDRCVVCGINFKMVFDNDDGVYKYMNCREIEMLNDDAAEVESEQVLIHVTCWRGLGSPVEITSDQALHDALHAA